MKHTNGKYSFLTCVETMWRGLADECDVQQKLRRKTCGEDIVMMK